MENVILCAVCVGGATLIGSALGFIIRPAILRYASAILSFAAGVMLAAAVGSLIAPSFEGADTSGVILAVLGIFSGAGCLYLCERVLPGTSVPSGARSATLFALAMAIHNLPEGIAAGLGFGSGDIGGALTVAIGIALHNIPEGMISVLPLISAGVKPHRAFLYSASGGIAEIIGTFIGYFATEPAEPILPFALSFAGGLMLYVVASEMLPEGQTIGRRRSAFLLIGGYVFLLLLGKLISGI